MAEKSEDKRERVDENAGVGGTIGVGGGGSNDVTSGGGNGTGVPDADTAMRAGSTVMRGDVNEDREKLFPETAGREDTHPGDRSPPAPTDHA